MSLAPELDVIKNNLKATGINVVVLTFKERKYIGFKDKEGKSIRIGIYLQEGCKYICTWGIQNKEKEKGGATMERWINKVKGICSNWEIGWEGAGKRSGGYPSNVKCIDGMELYEIIGELYKFM